MRPAFLTQPGAWVRSSRISQSPADYACAVERKRERAADWTMVALFALFVLLVAWGLA